MTDFLLLEKISELNNCTRRPRLLHQKGVAVHGHFCPYMSLSDYTKADFLQDPKKETPITARFSGTMREMGSGDSLRDTRGFAVRFKAEQGHYDLIGSNMPLFYINKPEKFLPLVRQLAFSQQDLGQEPNYWEFLAENPEAINLTMWLYSNKGTIKSYRFMEGYSINTYKWLNEKGEELYVRYRWKPIYEGEDEDEKSMGISYQEAEFLAGFSPDCCIRDLALALEEGHFPVYELEIQMMEKQRAQICEFDFLSTTLFWPEETYPYVKIGKMTLKEIASKEEGESLCFAPSNLVEGISFGNEEFLEIMDYAHKDGGRQRGGAR